MIGLAPTIEAACLLDELAAERGWTRDDRDAVEARCSAWAENNGRACFNVADVRFIAKTRAEALPRRTPGNADPEYADVDEAGQLSIGVAGDQRAIPGLAAPRKEN